jgi:hypothetical protein
MDFQNPKQRKIREKNFFIRFHKRLESIKMKMMRAKLRAKKTKIEGRKSHFRKWLGLLCTWEFFIEFVILIAHPFPYYDSIFKI